ncbi:Hypp7341 [Branchiostoma lanceolatum]|uniref:Hypp7341 protein n=1 Tax=Branchiostoma lanceolatum TaxID=7740 RepID=A0A8J9YZG9_BRALA|nr:Hypp7341 [Branchiostoma lanceolatum]
MARKRKKRLQHGGLFRPGNKPWNKGLAISQAETISSYCRPTEDQDSLYVNRDRRRNIIQNDIETLNVRGKRMVLRPTRLAGRSKISRFLGEKEEDRDDVEGYRIWHAKIAVHACASAQREHDKRQPECKGLVRLSARGEKKKGLATLETLVCDTCQYASPKRKFYGEVKREGRGPKIAVPNLAVQVATFNSPVGPTVIREIAAALDLTVPSRSGLQNMANTYSDMMVQENEKDLQSWRETVQDMHVEKGNAPGSGIPVQGDTRYQTPLRSARGKKPGQPSPNSVTSVAENVTTRQVIIGTRVRNKICQPCIQAKGSGGPPPPHKCPANIPEEAVIGDERQAAEDLAHAFLSGPNKTLVGEALEDGDSGFSGGMKKVMMEEAGQEVKVFKDIVHLAKGIRHRVTTASWSKQMFPGHDQDEKNRVRDRFGNDLSRRLNAEHRAGLLKFRTKRAMEKKMKQVMSAIPYCYEGDHRRCLARSLICRHPKHWKFKDLPKKARGNIQPSSADLKVLGKIMEHRLGKGALSKTRRGRTTNKVESFNRQLSKYCPKNVVISRTLEGRVASAVHSSNNGTGMSIAMKRAAANIPLSPNSAVVPALEGMERRQQYHRSYKMEVANKKRQELKKAQRFADYDTRKEQGTYKSKKPAGQSKAKGNGRAARKKKTVGEHSYTRAAEQESSSEYPSDQESDQD